MKVYNISYHFKNSNIASLLNNRSGLYDELKKFSAWWHYLESTWLIKTEATPNQILEKLQPHLVKDDLILIIEVTTNYQGLLPQEAWDWIHKNISSNDIL